MTSPSPAPVGPPWRRLVPGPWTLGVAGYAVLYLIGHALLRGTPDRQTAFGLLAFVPLNAATALALYAAGQRASRADYRRGFRCYAASFAITGVGTIIWTWQLLVRQQDPTWSWGNLPYLLSYPLAVAGILSLPVASQSRLDRWRLAVESAIAVVAGIALTWDLVVRPLYASDVSWFRQLLIFSYPVGDLLIFAVLVPLILRLPGRPGGALRPLAIGQMIYLTADLGYQLTGSLPVWMTVEWPDLFYLAGYIGITWGAERFFRSADAEGVTLGEVSRRRNLLPFALCLLVYALLLRAAWSGDLPAFRGLADAAITVTLLILVRESLTERQNLELTRALEAERSDLRFQGIVGGLAVGVLIQDGAGRTRLANAAAYQLLGTSERELLERSAADPTWNVLREDGTELPGDELPIPVALRTRQPVRNVVMGVFRPRTQDRIWLLVSAEPKLGDDGTVAEVVCTFHDITDRRALEAQLRQAQRMEAVGQLAGGVAHDFNNLLTAIIGYTALLEEQLERDHPMAEDIREIRRAADRAAGLTQQLLAFGRRQLLQPVVLDLNDVTRDGHRLFRRLLGEDIEIRLRLHPGLGPVRVDRGQLEQVLVNLVVNARDAMPTGGTLTIETDQVPAGALLHPEAPARAGTGMVLLRVADTGTGMDAATRARAFEPFFTTKEVGKGSGLGLATVYGIVRQSGGDAWIDARPGPGVTVVVAFPRVEEPLLPVEPAEEVASLPGGREQILVVEDEPAVCRVITQTLEARGYAVLSAHSAGDALEVLATALAPIDLLVTDIVMPGQSGVELARTVRRRRPGLPVIFISGHASEATVRYGLDLQRATLLPKPFLPVQLVLKVREALDQGRPDG